MSEMIPLYYLGSDTGAIVGLNVQFHFGDMHTFSEDTAKSLLNARRSKWGTKDDYNRIIATKAKVLSKEIDKVDKKRKGMNVNSVEKEEQEAVIDNDS